MIEIRALHTPEEYAACVALQRETWGAGFAEAVPSAILKINQQIGGVTAGAFDEHGALVGTVFGLTGWRHGEPVHWSHMLAVNPAFRDRGIGRRLKEFQREVLKAQNIKTMLWTFDPLVARNARLNLRTLGVRVVEYVGDMYGSNEASAIDSIIGTDRFIVEWELQTELARSSSPSRALDDAAMAAAAGTQPDLVPRPDVLPAARAVHVPIPHDIQQLKQHTPDIAKRWRLSTRAAFRHYLAAGYTVCGFEGSASDPNCFYRLER